MYESLQARLSLGQAQSAVEPLLYLSSADPTQADLQNATAVAIWMARSLRRERARDFAARAVALQPGNPQFAAVQVLADPARSRIDSDGTLLLSRDAAQELHAAAAALERGSPNMRSLASLLQPIEPEGRDPAFPFALSTLDKLLESPGLLLTRPDAASFEPVEKTLAQRIETLSAEAESAQASAQAAQKWLDDLKARWDVATPAERDRLQSESDAKRAEFDDWMKLAQRKLAESTLEITRLKALLQNDNATLASIRHALEPEAAITAQASASAALPTASTPSERIGAGPWQSQIHGYYALVIGNNRYQKTNKLLTAAGDAKAVAALLSERYGFKVNLLIDATRSQLVDSLYQLRALPKEYDNILIFYAGHGYYDDTSRTGYWIPVDADTRSPANWVSNSDITSQLRAVSARRILVIADSCFSGTLTRDVDVRPPDQDYLAKIVNRRTRLVISSGGSEPVSDDGPNGHSVFANAFLGALADNSTTMESMHLFEIVRRRVLDSAAASQVPQYATIRDAEHDGGEFFFIPRPPADH